MTIEYKIIEATEDDVIPGFILAVPPVTQTVQESVLRSHQKHIAGKALVREIYNQLELVVMLPGDYKVITLPWDCAIRKEFIEVALKHFAGLGWIVGWNGDKYVKIECPSEVNNAKNR